jgi:hypothetical protein
MPPSNKVFLKSNTGNGYYTTRGAVLRSHYLEKLLHKAESAVSQDTSKPPELVLPDEPTDELIQVMVQCEQADRSQRLGDPTIDQVAEANLALIESLEIEPLLRILGVCHRLAVQPLLDISASRVAKLLCEARGSTSDRAGVPLDAYMRRDEQDALTDEESISAVKEFIFTLPDAPNSLAAASAPVHIERYAGAWTSSTTDAATASISAGRHGTAGTGFGSVANEVSRGLSEGAEQLITLLGGEAPLVSVLVRCSAEVLQGLKSLGRRWRHRARAALCSGEWAEHMRGAADVLDLGVTRHWHPTERSATARFLADGRFSRLRTLRADAFEADLQPLLSLERVDIASLISSLTTNPAAAATSFGTTSTATAAGAGASLDPADALCAQSEFCALCALWVLGSSRKVRAADFHSLTYAGLLPISDALAPAVELASRRALETLIIEKATLPVRDLVGLPPPPPQPNAPAHTLARRTTAPATSVELKWQRLGALDAILIAVLLRANRTLTHLDLSWNAALSTAGRSGAIELAEAIAMNRTLRDVNLSETSLGDASSSAMCRAVAQNDSLTRLNLRACGLGSDSRAALEEAVKHRPASMPIELLL